MKTRISYILILLVTLLSCKESAIDTILPSIPDTNKTVSVTLTDIPTGKGGAPTYIFSLNSKGEVYAVEQTSAKDNTVVKIAPPSGTSSFDIVAFIPDDANWTTNKSFTSGQYSRVTGQFDRKGAFVTLSWDESDNLTSSSSSGTKANIEADLTINGSTAPSSTDFSQGSIISLDANVTDNIKSNIATVVFTIDKTELKSYNATPYKYQFNTASTALGSHTLYVKATNALGNSALDSIKIFISKSGNVGPSVSLTGLTNNAQYTRQQLITVGATVSDPDDGIDKVEFRIGNTLVATDRTAPYSYLWDTFSNAVGSVVVEVTAYDKAGQSRADVKNVILVAPTNYIPRVTITSPANGATVTAGTLISLAATASDIEGDAINRVEFWYRKSTALSDTFIGQDTTSPYAFDFVTTGLTPGEYFIFAEVFDNNGRSTYSNITITIN